MREGRRNVLILLLAVDTLLPISFLGLQDFWAQHMTIYSLLLALFLVLLGATLATIYKML